MTSGGDLCDLCGSTDVCVERTTYCGKTIGIDCGCDADNDDGVCNDEDCGACKRGLARAAEEAAAEAMADD